MAAMGETGTAHKMEILPDHSKRQLATFAGIVRMANEFVGFWQSFLNPLSAL